MALNWNVRLLNKCSSVKNYFIFCNKNQFSVSNHIYNFWEPSKKGEYEKEFKINKIEAFKEGFKMLPGEFKKFKNEMVNHFKNDISYDVCHNDYEILWKFNSPESIKEWIVSCDSDHNEGKSSANFILNQNKKGYFYGNLNTEVPKTGTIKSAGYCNITSPHKMKSFKRITSYDWSAYTHLLMKVRGDGRAYNLVLSMNRYWDLQWNDVYFFLLFTRGGPYWQLSKIPLSKFFLSSKGRVQDKQEAIQKDKILTLGITVADTYPGLFGLEIDYIGLINDETHKANFDYEMYQVSPHLMS